MKKFLLPLLLLQILCLGAAAQVTRGQFDTSKLYFTPAGGIATNYYWASDLRAYTNNYNHGWMRTNPATARWEYFVNATLVATNSTATNNWRGTNGTFTATSYWAVAGSASTSAPGISTNQAAAGSNTPPVIVVAATVISGTNANPNGIYTAGKGSIYNQFDVATGTNFVAQWIKNSTSGNTGWSVTAGISNNVPASVFLGMPKAIAGINVSDYGAVGFYTNNFGSWTGNLHSLPDYTTNIQAALNAAGSAMGNSNTVYFGPGIYRITTNLLVTSKVNIVGLGQYHDGRGGVDADTNGWTMIWVDNTNANGIVFLNQNKAHSEIRNIEICGFVTPQAGLAAFTEAPASSLANGVGVFVTCSPTTQNAGGFRDDYLGIHGFRVGMWCQLNNAVHVQQDHAGNDVGFVAWNNFTDPAYVNDSVYSNLFKGVFSLWNTNYQNNPANADNQIFITPNGGFRSGQVEYMLNNAWGFTILEEGQQNLSMFAILASTQLRVHGCLTEFNKYVQTNVFNGTCPQTVRCAIKLYYGNELQIDGLAGGVLGSLPASFTNWATIDASQGSWHGHAESLSAWSSFCNWRNTGKACVSYAGDVYGEMRNNNSPNDIFVDGLGNLHVLPKNTPESGWLGTLQVANASTFVGYIPPYCDQLLGIPTMQYPPGSTPWMSLIYEKTSFDISINRWISRMALSDPFDITNYLNSTTAQPPNNFTFNAVTVTGGVVTNNGVAWLSTNGVPAANLPNGSFATGTGQIYTRTNGAWVAIGSGGGGGGGVTSATVTGKNGVTNSISVSGSTLIGDIGYNPSFLHCHLANNLLITNNTYLPIVFDTVVNKSGINYGADGRITFTNAGTYQITLMVNATGSGCINYEYYFCLNTSASGGAIYKEVMQVCQGSNNPMQISAFVNVSANDFYYIIVNPLSGTQTAWGGNPKSCWLNVAKVN